MDVRNGTLGALKLAATGLAAALLVPLAARAQPIEGLYIGGGAGYNYLARVQVNSASPTRPPLYGERLQGDGGFLGALSVGYGVGGGFRVELQGDYRSDHQNLSRGAFQGGDGDTISYGGYLNALYDFDVGSPLLFPYLGAGIGYRETQLNAFSASAPGVAGSFRSDEESKGAFSAQAMIGLAMAVWGVPGLSLTGELRYTGVFSDETFPAAQNVGSGASSPASIKLGNQHNYSVMIGARYAFDVPPPPPLPAPVPAAAPAPAASRTYLVFFDWDRADITDRARQIIAEAAGNASRVQVTRIEVNGYTDRSGTAAYNIKLSERRAAAVKAELIHDGVAASEITTRGFGEENPLIPTNAGVREPQNRRVEILLK